MTPTSPSPYSAQILSSDVPYVLPPDSKWHSPILLKFVPNSSDCLFNTSLRLSTNASYYNIPLQCYDGRLEVRLHRPASLSSSLHPLSLPLTQSDPAADALEFGLLSNEDAASKIITVSNPNPVKVRT